MVLESDLIYMIIGRIIKSGLQLNKVNNEYLLTETLELLIFTKDGIITPCVKNPGKYDPRQVGRDVEIELIEGTKEVKSIKMV